VPHLVPPEQGDSDFDPYHRWLAIPRQQRPPTYYQLLGVAVDESDREVIEEAALRQTSHVRTYQTGPYAQQCTAILNELGQARATLLNPEKRKEYDTRIGLLAASAPIAPALPATTDLAWPAVVGFAAILCLGAGLAFGLALDRAPSSAPSDAAAPAPAVNPSPPDEVAP
jgi:hypothetical protein